jgi:ArsR family transcriptional regulator, arsenate/arsenite/antimonite-responsive transcriptional repressor
MAQAKTSAFDPALVRAAGLAKALAHPVRIRILEILAARRGCVCGGLVDLLPLAQSTVSQHLKELRDAGLIRGEIDGPRTCYCLDARSVAEAASALAGLFARLCREGCGRPATRAGKPPQKRKDPS